MIASSNDKVPAIVVSSAFQTQFLFVEFPKIHQKCDTSVDRFRRILHFIMPSSAYRSMINLSQRHRYVVLCHLCNQRDHLLLFHCYGRSV